MQLLAAVDAWNLGLGTQWFWLGLVALTMPRRDGDDIPKPRVRETPSPQIPRRPPRSYSATPVHPACKPLAPRKQLLQRAVSAPHTPTEQRPSGQWSNEGHGST